MPVNNGVSISELEELFTISGQEELPVEVAGRNFKIKTETITKTVAKHTLGLDNVDNTPDILKPISTDTQIALDSKAARIHTHTVNDIVGINDAIGGLQIQINDKANLIHTHAITDVTGLETELDTIKTKIDADIFSLSENLTEDINGKSDIGHVHAASEVLDFNDAVLAITPLPDVVVGKLEW